MHNMHWSKLNLQWAKQKLWEPIKNSKNLTLYHYLHLLYIFIKNKMESSQLKVYIYSWSKREDLDLFGLFAP